MTSTVLEAKTRVCKDCRSRKPEDEFPTDKFDRVDPRMCLQCVDENTPQLMNENELAKWLGVSIAEVRSMEPAGSYSPPKGVVVPLYSRPIVNSEFLPSGWRLVFDWSN